MPWNARLYRNAMAEFDAAFPVYPNPKKHIKLKFVSGYRAPSLAKPPHRPEYETGRDLAYKAWLAGGIELPHVNSYHDSRTFDVWRARVAEVMTPEIEERIAEQGRSLYRRAAAACERAERALALRGFGSSVRESSTYERIETIEECFNCEGAGRFPDGECCICHGYGVYLAEKYEARPCMVRDYGYFTDGQRFVYIGTERRRGYSVRERRPIQIIIGEGRDPSDYEIAMMLDEALDANEEFFAEAAE